MIISGGFEFTEGEGENNSKSMKEIKGKCNKIELARIHNIGNYCTLHLIIIFYLYLYPDCFIYHFETDQDLSTEALKVEYFTIKGSLFLAFADF